MGERWVFKVFDAPITGASVIFFTYFGVDHRQTSS